ncbi:TPA: hypothetical protein ACJEWJ_005878 [Klebsiella quasipneumoniae]
MEKTNNISRKNKPLQNKASKIWHSMHARAGKVEGYLDVTIAEEWYEFENFYNWYVVNYVEGWHLDKDIKVEGNRQYGPDTCIMVPAVINSLFTRSDSMHGYKGVYFDSRSNKYYAQMRINGKTVQSGHSVLVEEAHRMFNAIRRGRINELRDQYSFNIPLYNALQQYI